MTKTIYDYKVKDIAGADYDLAQLQGKKVMIVNTASACGLTPQYEGLQALYEANKDKNVVIIGFPANNFMGQEPGSDDEIATFCKKNYGVTFPMMSKIDVTGKNKHPLYEYLTTEALNGHSDNKVTWNFQKYLINTSGTIDKVIGPKEAPDSAEVLEWLSDK